MYIFTYVLYTKRWNRPPLNQEHGTHSLLKCKNIKLKAEKGTTFTDICKSYKGPRKKTHLAKLFRNNHIYDKSFLLVSVIFHLVIK